MASLLSFFTHKIFKALLALYLGLFFLIWLISSPVAKYYINPILAEHQLQLSDNASIRFNPFLMRITMSDINLSSTKDNQETTVFSLEELKLQVALWQLAFDKVVLSQFSLTQGTLKITQHDEHLVIAGITIPSSAKEAEQVTEEIIVPSTEETVEKSGSSLPYQLIVPDFLLSQFTIEIENNIPQKKNQSHLIKIEQLLLNQVKATQNEQQANLVLAALIDKTHLALSANAHLIAGKGDISSNISLDNYPVEKLTHYVEQLTELNGSLSFDSQLTMTLAEQGTNFRVKKASLNLQDIVVGLKQQHLTLTKLQYDFRDLAIDLQDNLITHLAGESSIILTDAVFNDNKSKAKIAAFKQLNLDEMSFVLDDEPSIDIANIVLDGFMFSKKATLAEAVAQKAIDRINKLSAEDGIDIAAKEIVELPPVMQLKQLTVNKIHIHAALELVNIVHNIKLKENRKVITLSNLLDLEFIVSAKQNGKIKLSHKPV